MAKLPERTLKQKIKAHLDLLKRAINTTLHESVPHNAAEKELVRKAYKALSELYNRLHRHLL